MTTDQDKITTLERERIQTTDALLADIRALESAHGECRDASERTDIRVKLYRLYEQLERTR